MATNIQTLSAVSSDATWRERVAFVSALLDTAGQTKTADTGQINTSTATQPTSNNSSTAGGGGYEIRAFTDALGGLKYKIEYGRGSAAGALALWFTVGTGSDGSGGITGIIYPRTQIDPSLASAEPSAICYGSAGTNYFWFMFGSANADAPRMIASMFRSHDADGDQTADGVIVLLHNNTNPTVSYADAATATVTTDSGSGTQLVKSPPSGVGTDSLPDGNRAVLPIQPWDRTKLVPPISHMAMGKDTGFTSLTEYDPVLIAGKSRNVKAFTLTAGRNLGRGSGGLWNTWLVQWE